MLSALSSPDDHLKFRHYQIPTFAFAIFPSGILLEAVQFSGCVSVAKKNLNVPGTCNEVESPMLSKGL